MEETDELAEELESSPEAPQQEKAILDVSVVPFEPITTGNGQGLGEKENRLAKAILERIPAEDLEQLRKNRASRLVTVTVLFYLWKGSADVSNMRPVKDLDNLLKILFDTLRLGPQGLGILESDSYICELYASKQLVESEDEEGYRIIIEEYDDEPMLRVLKDYHSKKKR